MQLQVLATDPMLAQDVVDNPAEFAERMVHPTITVTRTIRNDPVWVMYAKGQIDAAQLKAAREWQRLNEVAGPRIKSSGHLEEPVDGGGHVRDGLAQQQIDAHKRLMHFAQVLGPRQHHLLELVLVNGLSAWGATAALFPDEITNERRRFTATWFKEILSILARDMRLSS